MRILLFSSRLSEAFHPYTNLDPDSGEGQSILALHIISQSAVDIWSKLQKLEKGPHTAQAELVDLAFKVFNNHDEARQEEKRE